MDAVPSSDPQPKQDKFSSHIKGCALLEIHRCVKREDRASFSLCLGLIFCDNEPATEGCSGNGLGLGRAVGITVTAEVQGEGGELNMRAIFIEGGGRGRQEERTREEDQNLQEEVFNVTGSIINTGCTCALRIKQKHNKALLQSFLLTNQLRFSVHHYLLKLCTIQQWLCLVFASKYLIQ